MVETYSIWNLHGEQLDNASSSNATRVDNIEPIVDPNEQVMDIINDAFPFASTNINQEGEDDMPTPMDKYMMMTVLITEDPGRSIDVYLRPLVDELKDLWTNGVRTYDKATGKMFTLRAAVMWTVNDFPAYAMVSGWSTKGYMACPVCKENLTSGWHAGKVCYLGHRRWLSWDHEWREKDKEFDGNTEHRLRPREWSGDEILEQLNRLDFSPFGKTVTRTRPATHLNWTHKSMFFELPYWSKLKLRHNLDVMHVEKNVFDTLVGRILDIEGKTKDTIKARLDLERMGIRRDVDTAFNRPQRNNDGGLRNETLSVFAQSARPFGDPVRGESFSRNDMEVAHWFVLNNCDEIMSYLDEHEEMMKREHPSHLYAKKHRELFPKWFLEYVKKLKSSNSPSYSEELYNLAFGPIRAELFSGCHVNGVKFLGTARDDKLCTQNSGVHVPGGGESTDVDFYGKLTTVVQLLYKDRYQVIMFKCRWFDTNPNRQGSVKIDHGLLSVNINRTWYDDDPYILANMARQIVYLDDPKAGSGWKVAQQMDQRNVYAIPELDPTDNDIDNVTDQRLDSSMETDAKHFEIRMLYKNRFSFKEYLQSKYRFGQLQFTSVIFRDMKFQWARTMKVMRRRIGRPKVMIARITKVIIVQMMNNAIH
ncbi:unnamed protein product [Prunus brigantina]